MMQVQYQRTIAQNKTHTDVKIGFLASEVFSPVAAGHQNEIKIQNLFFWSCCRQNFDVDTIAPEF